MVASGQTLFQRGSGQQLHGKARLARALILEVVVDGDDVRIP